MRFTIPFAAKPKARPRVNADGHTWMPHDYTDWKEKVAELVGYSGLRKRALEGDIRVEMAFSATGVDVLIIPSMVSRPKGVGGDLDNLVGGMLDALQDAGLIANDRNVVEISATFDRKEPDYG